MKISVVVAVGLVLLCGCAGPHRETFDAAQAALAQPAGFSNIRVSPQDAGLAARLENDLRNGLRTNPSAEISILSLSGGGADGAFGIGVLTGWSERGDRPQFSVVTGVSTGALIAPFAYLGSSYDAQLKEAYLGEGASNLLKSKGLGAFFSPGAYSSEGLKARVAKYVSIQMVEDIADENSKGRRLQIGTTNLDSQTGVIWDLGAIASQGVAQGPAGKVRARDLIREILVASASIPGAFAPAFIPASFAQDGASHVLQEMHADGSVTMPLFILPESMLTWQVPPDVALNARLYVLINGNINPRFTFTKYGAVDIITRSIDTLARAQARATLFGIQAFSTRNGFKVSVASLPDDFTGGGLMAFDSNSMKRVYDKGYSLALSGIVFQDK
ncbi:patatin-like phospholipase family protein [Asticcacaulis excentricus]|uniref:patatin-like phospholipase family protein n=1 Tax=Asticcacaulis excentricus TaxID=78587 RepID=UPI00059FCD02|nr:patatin-like phospholipase family protein [Asticcacaulis excentricus]